MNQITGSTVFKGGFSGIQNGLVTSETYYLVVNDLVLIDRINADIKQVDFVGIILAEMSNNIQLQLVSLL